VLFSVEEERSAPTGFHSRKNPPNIEFSSAAAPLQPNRFNLLKHPAIDKTPGDCCNDLLGFNIQIPYDEI